MKPKKPISKRPFLGVLFECCRVYLRIYRNPEDEFYVGRCPRCGKVTRFRVGADGSNARFWSVR